MVFLNSEKRTDAKDPCYGVDRNIVNTCPQAVTGLPGHESSGNVSVADTLSGNKFCREFETERWKTHCRFWR